MFNLSNINWEGCHKFALSNLVKIACEYKNHNPELSTTDIGKLMNIHRNTICKWLKQGNGIWCEYNVEQELKRNNIKGGVTGGKLKGKNVLMFNKKEQILGVFESCYDLERKSEKLFGVKLHNNRISEICRNERLCYKGYHFKYISDLTQEEHIKYNIENKLKELHNRELVQAC